MPVSWSRVQCYASRRYMNGMMEVVIVVVARVVPSISASVIPRVTEALKPWVIEPWVIPCRE